MPRNYQRKNTKNRSRGRKAKAVGAQFENAVERSCIRYRTKGIAHIQKTPEPFKLIGVKGKYAYGFIEKKAQPDFTGTLSDGRSVIFEAKHTNSTNIPFDRISYQQELELDIHEELGALTFVLVTFSFKTFYTVPWADWKRLKETVNKKSVNEKDLEPFQIEVNDGLIDFLNSEE